MKTLVMLLLGFLGYLCATATATPLSSLQQPSENVNQLIQEVQEIATEAGTASNAIYSFIVRIKFAKINQCKVM